MKYEIVIPAVEPDGFDMRLRIDAESWMAALKIGIKRLGVGVDVKHLVVDMRGDESALVTEPATGRTFDIRPLASEEAAPAPTPPAPASSSAPAPAPPAPTPEPVFESAPAPTEFQPLAAPLGQTTAGGAAAPALRPARPRDRAQERRLIHAFHRGSRVMAAASPAEAAEICLDIALEIIPAEAGAVLFADIAQQDMFIAFARGANVGPLLNSRIAFGAGISGHAVLYGLPLSVNDVVRDFRFDPSLPEGLGTSPVAMLCAPALRGGRTFGALHLVNRAASGHFADGEAEVLAYVAARFAEFLESYYLRVA